MANHLTYRAMGYALSLFLLVPISTTVHSEASAPVDPWKDTDLDFSFIKRNVTSQSCRQSEQRFLACISAIQAVLDHDARKLKLERTEQSNLDADSAAVAVVRRFGFLAVTEEREHSNGDSIDVLEEIKARHQRRLAWRAVYRSRRGETADFDWLLDWVLSEVVEPGNTEAYAAAAINGYISVADAHARIFPASARQAGMQADSGNVSTNRNGLRYTGVGVAVQSAADAIIITGILNESPAAWADLRVSDVILAIDSQPVDGKPVPEVVASLRGPAGTEVTLTLKTRDAVRETRVRRAAVEVMNVSSLVLEDRGWHWGYLRIRSFASGNTCFEVRRELRELERHGIDGVVLDVRDNMGGHVDQAVCVADQFLEPRLVVVELRRLKGGQQKQRFRSRYPALTQVPLVSLVNANTGSASEVLVGALQDHGRALVVGERTFGKGTMQRIRQWSGSRSVLELYTAARMYSPLGRNVQMAGITPDIPIYDQPDGAPDSRIVLREEDLFPMALPAEQIRTTATAKIDIAKLHACVAKQSTVERRRGKAKSENGLHDYPVYVAQNTLVCRASDPAYLSTRQ